LRHYIQLHLLVLLITSTGILGKLIQLETTALVSWRTLLAALGAAAWVGLVLRLSPWPGWRQARVLIGIGMIVGVHWLCFFGAIKLSNLSICLAGMATISLFTAFTEPFLERRRVRPFEVLLGLLVVAGILLVAGFERGHLGGLLVAVLGAFLAAIFPVLNRKLVSGGSDSLVMVSWEMVGAFIAAMALHPLFGGEWKELVAFGKWDWLWLLCLAWVCTVFGHGFHIRLLRYLSAYTSNLAFNFEPVYGMIAAALLFGEHKQLHPLFYVGMGTILLANALHPFLMRRFAKRVP
jgi:drug/metabolite transporter (DMT)-like permease